MRTLIILLLLAFSLSAQAQIVSELSFDKKTKTISLKLENQFDETVFLFPKRDDYDEKATHYKVIYKDANGKIVNKYTRLICNLRDRGILLTAKETRDYQLKLSPEEEVNIHSVEISLHIEARNALETLFVENISKTYKWK